MYDENENLNNLIYQLEDRKKNRKRNRCRNNRYYTNQALNECWYILRIPFWMFFGYYVLGPILGIIICLLVFASVSRYNFLS